MSKSMEEVVDLVRRGRRSSRRRLQPVGASSAVVPAELSITPPGRRQLKSHATPSDAVVPAELSNASVGGSRHVSRAIVPAELPFRAIKNPTEVALVPQEDLNPVAISPASRRRRHIAPAHRKRSSASDLDGFIVQSTEGADDDEDYIPEDTGDDDDGETEESQSSSEDESFAEESEEEEDEESSLSLSDSDSQYQKDLELLERYLQERNGSDWPIVGASKKRARKHPTRRKLRPSGVDGEPCSAADFQEAEIEMLDPEEDVDVDEAVSYQPLDLESFGGREALRAASAASVKTPPSELQPAAEDDVFAGKWGDLSSAPRPGEPGFNLFATARLRSAGIGKGVLCSPGSACPPLQPHQESVAFLLHPSSPVKRLLVDHPTGSGKTREMITVLNGLFFDIRPKVPIFPTQAVCRNFYLELLRWPSRYRDYYCCICPGGALLASGAPLWRTRRQQLWDLTRLPEASLRDLARSCREVLEMKGAFFEGQMRAGVQDTFAKQHPGEPFPGAPLRALGFASAGGAHARLDALGRPASAFLKVGHPRQSSNVYDQKIVLMDEVHNLVRTESRYAMQLSVLRDLLFAAEGVVLAGFTGTPILSGVHEGRKLLDIIKGRSGSAVDEGYLSSLAVKPPALFPRCQPGGVPDVPLTSSILRQLCHKVCLHSEALQSYVLKTQVAGLPELRLRAYCNLHTYAGAYNEGSHGCKEFVLRHPERCSPKFIAAAQQVAKQREKALVLVARGSGYRAALDLFRQAAAAAPPTFNVASMDQMAEFNAADNLRGERFLCLVADSAQCGEGVSFRAVRQLHLLDVPSTPTMLVQQCGRASRMLGHHGLPQEEQCVRTHLYTAVLPSWARDPLGAWCLRTLARRGRHGPDTERHARLLLAHLKEKKVKSLEALKARLESVGIRKARSLQRQRGSKDMQSREERDAPFIPELEKRGQLRVVRLCPEDVAQLFTELGLGKDAGTKGKLFSKGRPWLHLALYKAFQELYAAEAAELSGLETADELAIGRLAKNFGAFAGALATLRAQAIDKEVLAEFAVQASMPPERLVRAEPPKRRLQGKQPLKPNAGIGGEALVAAVPVPAKMEVPVESVPSKRRRLMSKQSSSFSKASSTSSGTALVDSTDSRKHTAPEEESADSKGPKGLSSHPLPANGAPNGSSLKVDTCLTRSSSPKLALRDGRAEAPATGVQLEELRGWSVRALKDVIAGLRPDVDLRGVLEKEELCELIRPWISG
eukprot:TRINITY_DN34290_c0_g1_i1.p1 TRINITY_DN34290_c0_g1~~TRINITY_DN34290_c0_g1_i1.p1  ORF type:complete len:1244 (-),score=285.12 TRINITY_DN34290_c0_g1_i1:72-3764(-)